MALTMRIKRTFAGGVASVGLSRSVTPKTSTLRNQDSGTHARSSMQMPAKGPPVRVVTQPPRDAHWRLRLARRDTHDDISTKCLTRQACKLRPEPPCFQPPCFRLEPPCSDCPLSLPASKPFVAVSLPAFDLQVSILNAHICADQNMLRTPTHCSQLSHARSACRSCCRRYP